MFSLEIECDADDRDLLIAELWEQGSAGVVELDARRVRAFFDDGARRDALLELFPGASDHTLTINGSTGFSPVRSISGCMGTTAPARR